MCVCHRRIANIVYRYRHGELFAIDRTEQYADEERARAAAFRVPPAWASDWHGARGNDQTGEEMDAHFCTCGAVWWFNQASDTPDSRVGSLSRVALVRQALAARTNRLYLPATEGRASLIPTGPRRLPRFTVAQAHQIIDSAWWATERWFLVAKLDGDEARWESRLRQPVFTDWVEHLKVTAP